MCRSQMPVTLDALVDVWPTWSEHVRQGALVVHDAALAQRVDAHVRSLWEAEIKARQLGVEPLHCFDHTRLPLLSTMQFDEVENGSPVARLRWPREVAEDAAIIPAILRCELGVVQAVGPTTMTRVPRVLAPGQWRHLVQTPPATWIDLERTIALLVEQLLLRVLPRSRVAAEQPHLPAAREPVDREPAEEETTLTGRAAKRAMQRLRRKAGKALTRAQAGDVDVEEEP